MALVDVINLDYSVGGPLLLERVNLTLEPRERVCIVGRNGAGKSTLMKLMAKALLPDDGEVRHAGRIAALAQEVPIDIHGTIEQVVARGLGDLGEAIARFHYLSAHLEEQEDSMAAATEMGDIQTLLDSRNGWQLELRVQQVLARLDLDPERQFETLSGGMKRRVLLGQALVQSPDVLLLDEPTNHLDIEAIQWLEDFLIKADFSCVFVTHDRSFLRRLATRIIEIDRGKVSSWPGDYDNYLRRREERLHAEAQENALFDKKLAAEEVWIRQGIKARRTRNEGRVTALKALRMERAQRRNQQGNVKMVTANAESSGKRVIETKDASLAFGPRTLVRNLSTVVQRGDRIGIIGPNGSGKTTLLKLLLGDLEPDSGEVQRGSNLQVSYFDQLRSVLDDRLNALENVAEGREFVELNGQSRHVLSYLQDFLFTPERARAPITHFSGGERNRLLLAKLFLRPSNVLVLDEPTNDLDIETLDLLEELLADYPGTVLIVSHDRDFLDQVVTGSLVLEGDGAVREVAGGYSDWWRERGAALSRQNAERAKNEKNPQFASSVKSDAAVGSATNADVAAPASRRKLSFKESRELSELPLRIEILEQKQTQLTQWLGDPAALKANKISSQDVARQLSELAAELEQAYKRWAELDG